MAEKQRSKKKSAAPVEPSETFTAEERAAMQERAKELKAAARGGGRGKKSGGEQDVLDKIAEMEEPDRALAQGLHAVVAAHAPQLSPKTWYGVTAWNDEVERRVVELVKRAAG